MKYIQKRNPVWDAINQGISDVGDSFLQKKLRDQARNDQVKQAILEGVLSNKIKPKEGADFSQINLNGDYGSVLGNIQKNFEPSRPPTDFEINLNALRGMGGQGQDQGGNVLGGDTSTPTISNDKLMRGMVSKQFGVPYEDMATPEERQAALEQKSGEAAVVASAKEQASNLGKVRRLTPITDMIEKEWYKTNPGASASGGRVSGLLRQAAGVTQTNPNVSSYITFSQGMKAQLARAMGDVGNLNEQEQKAALELIPKVGDTKEVGEAKIAKLREFISTLEQASQGGNKFTGHMIQPKQEPVKGNAQKIGKYLVEVE